MDLEKAREQLSRFLGQVAASPLFDQREIRLADRFAELPANGADQLRLRQLASEPAQLPLEVAKLTKLLTQRHC